MFSFIKEFYYKHRKPVYCCNCAFALCEIGTGKITELSNVLCRHPDFFKKVIVKSPIMKTIKYEGNDVDARIQNKNNDCRKHSFWNYSDVKPFKA